MTETYIYEVREVLRVVDGDTIDCRISLGFGLSAAFRFRLYGFDAPELFGPRATPAGQAATEFTRHWVAAHADRLLVRTHKGSRATVGIGDGAFGRWLADFFTAEGDDLAAALAEAGYTA